MTESYCEANCKECGYGKSCGCKGCAATDGCPFGTDCFIAGYIRTGGKDYFEQFKAQLEEEFNALGIPGLPKITELFALNGAYVNLAYPLPGGGTAKLLDDSAVYLGNQVECEFSRGEADRCFGLVADPTFLLVCEYGENGADPEIILYKKR